MRLFNTQYNPSDAVNTTLIPSGFDENRFGWIELQESVLVFEDLVINTSCIVNSTGSFKFSSDYKYRFTCSMIAKCFNPSDSTITIQNQPASDGSYILIYVDDDDGGLDVSGSVTLEGTDTDDAVISDTVTIGTDSGTYISSKQFKTITSVSVTDVTSSAIISLWGDIGEDELYREIQIWCDTNDDANYGLMFAGYIRFTPVSFRYNHTYYRGYLDDYDMYLRSRDYVVGYRTDYRCENYNVANNPEGTCDKFGLGGDADNHWGSTCIMGDCKAKHPPFGDSLVTDDEYVCTEYSAGTERLPWDGYSYITNYSPDTDSKYKWCPDDYFDAMLAIQILLECYEEDEIVSRGFKLFANESGEIINSNMTTSATTVTIQNDLWSNNGFTLDTDEDWIARCDDELMTVTGFSVGTNTVTLTVTRAIKNTLAAPHTIGKRIEILEAGDIGNGMADNVNTLLIKPIYTGSVYSTGSSIANNSSYRFEDEDVVFWVDFYKQLHIMEFHGADVKYSGDLTFSLDDDYYPILDVFNPSATDVVNFVTMDVQIAGDEDKTVRCQMGADSISTSYGNSFKLFGKKAGELDFELVNSVYTDSYSDGYFGFQTHALRFLKKNAFPTHRQTIRLFGFVPDEHYWVDGDEPKLYLTDTLNKCIDLRGRQCKAPDFMLEGTPEKTFVIENINYKAQSVNMLYTDIVMSRITEPGDFGFT
jgi:hypothetical protein